MKKNFRIYVLVSLFFALVPLKLHSKIGQELSDLAQSLKTLQVALQKTKESLESLTKEEARKKEKTQNDAQAFLIEKQSEWPVMGSYRWYSKILDPKNKNWDSKFLEYAQEKTKLSPESLFNPLNNMLLTKYNEKSNTYDNQSVNDHLKEICEFDLSKIKEDTKTFIKKLFAGKYKIHLMPKPKDLGKVLKKITEMSEKNKNFEAHLEGFKIHSAFLKATINNEVQDSEEKLTSEKQIFPVIVIYPIWGKQAAQEVLDTIVKEFGDMEGLDLTPRWNKKVTSLIYYAQGNGDDKKHDHLKRYYTDDLVHFKEDFTGEKVDHTLNIEKISEQKTNQATFTKLENEDQTKKNLTEISHAIQAKGVEIEWSYRSGYIFCKTNNSFKKFYDPFLNQIKKPDVEISQVHNFAGRPSLQKFIQEDGKHSLEDMYWRGGAQFKKLEEYLTSPDELNLIIPKNKTPRELLMTLISGTYKIHLMPKHKDLEEVLTKVLDLYHTNEAFGSNVDLFKVKYHLIRDLKKPSDDAQVSEDLGGSADGIFPVIVIYPMWGKQAAQEVLDTIVKEFGDMEGLDLTPRWNRKVTSLIYYAQGNGDDKKHDHLKKYYTDDLVHFKKDFTGEEVDHTLNIEKKDDLVLKKSNLEELTSKTPDSRLYFQEVEIRGRPRVISLLGIFIETSTFLKNISEEFIKSPVRFRPYNKLFWTFNSGYYFQDFSRYKNEEIGENFRNEITRKYSTVIDFLGLDKFNKNIPKIIKTIRNFGLNEYNAPEALESLNTSLKEIEKNTITVNKKTLARFLAGTYKIHLMPKAGDFEEIIKTLLHERYNNEIFIENTSQFKLSLYTKSLNDNDANFEKYLKISNNLYLPAIVIYPLEGKESAQKLLNEIIRIFKNKEGRDLTPRWNRKVTSLIYYAQGNGGDKKHDHLKKYYTDDLVHFKEDFTGEKVDHTLNLDALKNITQP